MKLTKTFQWIMTAVVSATMVSCYPGSSPYPYPHPDGRQDDPRLHDGASYKQSLEAAIMGAEQIVVEEHSATSDFHGIEGITKTPTYRYAKRVLTLEQKARLLANVRAMHPSTRTLFTRCTFVPHHTISFSSAGQTTSRIKICYQCGDVKWNGSSATEPANILSALTPTIQAVGMQTSRDWKRLAQDKFEKESNPGRDQPDGIPIAKKVPGKPGFVYNPFTGKEVEVAGIPPRTKVRDPNDTDVTHIFRVP